MDFSLDDIAQARSGDFDGVLEMLDEYSLYAFYTRERLGEDPLIGGIYCSPLRPDDNDPSFGIYRARKMPGREFGWKDQGKGVHGDIFDLVQRLYGLKDRYEALAKICGDHGLGAQLDVRPLHVVPVREKRPVKISIKSRIYKTHELDWWWDRYGADRARLQAYHTTTPSCYWMYEDQTVPWYPKGMCYAYRIFDRYQLYFPQANKALNERKFVNDWTEACVPGYAQLTHKHDTLLVTKAYKDVICVSGLDVCDVVGYRGENVPLPEAFWQWARATYKHVYIWVDNDGKSVHPLYDRCSMIYNPADMEKDPSDMYCRFGRNTTKEYLLFAMNRISEKEQDLNNQYAGRSVTLDLARPYTGVVDRVALEVIGERRNVIFFFKQGLGTNRMVVEEDELKEIIHVHS